MSTENHVRDQYRFFNITTTPVEKDKVLVYSRQSGISKFFTPLELQLLLSCQTYSSLTDHVKNYCRKQKREQLSNRRGLFGKLIWSFFEYARQEGLELPISEEEIEPFRKKLQEWLEAGFLISKKELRTQVEELITEYKASEDISENIRILGIPTRNRAKLLARCVQSFARNFHQNHRECVIHIVDDSDKNVEFNQYQQNIEEICRRYKVETLWIDRVCRHQLAENIAKTSGIPLNITKFILLGDLRCDFRVGGSRNTLLLLAAGKRSVQVDDDIVCRVIPSPDIDAIGIALSSEADCNEYWFCNNTEDIMTKQECRKKIDFLSLYETLLGKHTSALIRSHKNVNIDYLGEALLEHIGQPEAHIAVTYLGILGDSGMYWHWPRLLLEGDSFKRLVENGSSYTNYVRARKIMRGTSQKTISSNAFCMAGNIGLDTCRFLPPFMPVQRNEDGIFGQLLHLCFKKISRGYMPYAVFHDPPNQSANIDLSYLLSVGPLRTNDILGAILGVQSQWPFSSDPSHNLSIIGQYLFDLSQLPIHHFKAKLRSICCDFIRMRVTYVQEGINSKIDAPQYWQKDAKQVLANFETLLLREDLCVPCDLPGSISERLTLFQELLGKFGQVLIHWPVIWEVATEINLEQELQDMRI